MIEIIVGTNRRGSTSSALAKWLLKYYQGLEVNAQIMDLVDLPLETFSPESYKKKPQAVLDFTDRILGSIGLVIVTPEYNGSMPGSLKLFIDLLPFPESFEGRPVCYVGLAAGQFGGLRPVEHLMQVFSYRNAHNYPNRVFLPHSHNLIDLKIGVTDKASADRLHNQAQGFVDYCKLVKPKSAIV